jgi:signal transduction histidine kinase
MSAPRRERFQLQLATLLERIDEPSKIYKAALAAAAQELGAAAGAVILRHPVSGALQTIAWGAGHGWDDGRIRAFLDLQHPDLPRDEIMAPIVAGGRALGVMVLRAGREGFADGDGRWLSRVCRKVAHEVALREERRINRAVDQIKDKTVRELRPKDLFYQVLHGLRTLTRYDHSSALLIAEEDGARLVLHAEQIAWDKKRSARIGRRLKVPPEARTALRRSTEARVAHFPAGRGRGGAGGGRGRVPGDHPGGGEHAAADLLGRLLRWGGKGDEPAEGSILWAPLRQDGDLLGVLKIASIQPRALGAPETEAVDRVLRHIASVIHNARRALSMEERIIAAEKKHAMADLARAISHDVKNAIGAILPLAQQAREEVETGRVEPRVLAEDLRQIEQSAQICQRIFDGMLQLSRSDFRPAERAPLARILEGTLAILGNRMKRAGVVLEMKIPDVLPEVSVSRGGLEQVFLNLFTNAIESMPAGGKLRVQARAEGPGRLEVKISDSGAGIPPEMLKRIHEPFYTTKEEGFGLGLAIVRSILWDAGGSMQIESQPGRGTMVIVGLPAAADPGWKDAAGPAPASDPRPRGTGPDRRGAAEVQP